MPIRTFIAFDTTPEQKEFLAGVASELRRTEADVRWEAREKYHATVKFLGDTDESLLPQIYETIRRVTARYAPISLVFDKLGCFPNMRAPRVLWAGCSAQVPAIGELKIELDRALKQFGFEIEQRAFHPHITLGRFRSDRGAKHLISTMEKIRFETFTLNVAELLFIQSVLSRVGSHYTTLHQFDLAAGYAERHL